MGAALTDFGDVLECLETQGDGHARGLEVDGVRVGLEIQWGRGTVGVADAGGHVPAGCEVLLVVGAGEQLGQALCDLAPRRVFLLPLPCNENVARLALEQACAAADAYAQSATAERLVDVGMALNAERDPGKVLEMILRHARQITAADAGSLYLVENEGKSLRFKVAQNDSVVADFSEFMIPVTQASVVGTCVLTGHIVNISDLYVDPVALGRTFHHDRSFDERFGYQTRSMITTPMRPPDGEVLGVIQLINAKKGSDPLRGDDFDHRVRPFTTADERLCAALAAQGAVALENARLYAEIQDLFEGFVRASVHAIEQRDPTTSGHSQRVADLTVGLARVVDGVSSGAFGAVRFSPEDLREVEYAGLLHDFGKVGVREEVLVKAKKLYEPQLDLIMARFDHMRTVLVARLFEGQLERAREGRLDDADLRAECERRLRELDDMISVVLEANEPAVLVGDEMTWLQEIARLEFRDSRNRRIRLLDDEEVTALLIPKGSLTESERVEIQSHVTHTYNFLVRIPWGSSLARVPEIAGKHHEYLDGTGYPHRIGDPEIPVQTRMMTISDIFDALTAADRPYKKSVPVGRALEILEHEVKGGRVDGELLEVFVGSRVFEAIGLSLP